MSERRNLLKIFKRFFKPILFIGVSIYALITVSTPLIDPQIWQRLSFLNISDNNVSETLGTNIDETGIESDNNRLVIPAIDLNEQLFTDPDYALDKGLWQKYPRRSNPLNGGNMVITGHRVTFGLTPLQTLRESPLIHIDKLKIGDKITVDWEGKPYDYKITQIETVSKDTVEIEKQTIDPMLTLYTCTLLGSEGPRVMVRATPVKTSKVAQF